jgi:hypothetical protein
MGVDILLPLLPVPDFVLPGLFLLLVMGLAPLILAFGLLARPNWPWADALARWSGHYWAWTGTLALGIVLLNWLAVQLRADWLQRRDSVCHGRQRLGAIRLWPVAFGQERLPGG